MPETLTLADLVLSAGVAFFLGSIPIAWMVSRWRGVSIFAVGTRQAGATNVFREVGRGAALIVGLVDAGKGALAIMVGTWAGLEGSWLLLPAVAAIMGHWNSPLTRFRGGDGVITAVGVMIAISPTGTIVPILVGITFALAIKHRFAHPSAWGGILGFATLNILAAVTDTGMSGATVAGMTLIAASILLHSYAYHRRMPGAVRIEVLDEVLDGEHPDAQIPRTQGPQAPA
ncbi:MAG: glycerol-3-phosphate acyltransferase [Dehalococcoidia bacterium]|jgi:glycerol-3-phosphate acyltransferase PlsY|nr:glycerol-3-phosphate acyltransferase [Dehalococcoidia bacterium]